jgi:hypothetical protein
LEEKTEKLAGKRGKRHWEMHDVLTRGKLHENQSETTKNQGNIEKNRD